MAVSIGGAGADSFVGTAGSDFFAGGGGADTLRGGLSIDTLDGGDGDDLIEGGRGFDRLSGGAGNDTFFYSSRLDMGGDRITDFGAGDRIDLSALGTLVWGFDYGASGEANQLRYRTATLDNGTIAGTEIVFDLDGDTIIDGSIFLVGTYRLQMLSPGIITAVANEDRRGTAQGDTLSGSFGRDTLRGLEGADSLNGGDGNDRLFGGNGDDTLRGGVGTDILVGGAGNDVFQFTTIGQIGGDQVRDLEAGDRIDLSAVLGLRFIGDALFSGLAGEMRYDASNLTIDMDGDGLTDRSISVSGGAALEETSAGSRIFRMASAQVLTGTEAANTVSGGAAADSLSGLDGADSLAGGFDDDTLDGGAGNDTLLGGSGNDVVRGGDGDDLLIGGQGGDTLAGGAGNDVFRVTSPFDTGLVAGAAGAISLPGESGRFDVITDFAAGDLLDLSALGPLIYRGEALFEFEAGEVVLGTTSIQETTSFGSTVTVFFPTLRIDRDGDGVADLGVLLRNFRGLLEETSLGSGIFRAVPSLNLTGTAGAEALTGGAAEDTLAGLDGPDTLSGLGRADSLLGGAGNDLLLGGAGFDTLVGGLGNDTLVAGADGGSLDMSEGDDVARFSAADESFTASLSGFSIGDRIDLSAFTNLVWAVEVPFSFGPGSGTAMTPFSFGFAVSSGGITEIQGDSDGDGFADIRIGLTATGFALQETAPGSRILLATPPLNLIGTVAGETLTGSIAGDTLSGLGGADTLLGLAGADTLLGGEDNDLLRGGEGNDSLNGGLGNDLLVAGAGNDTLAMGEGDDTARFEAFRDLAATTGSSGLSFSKTLLLFGAGDRIDLSALGSFEWLGAGIPSSTATADRAYYFTTSQFIGGVSVFGTALTFQDFTPSSGFFSSFTTTYNIWLPGYTGVLDIAVPGSGLIEGVAPVNLLGTESAETLSGAAAADTLSGAGGNDTLIGGAGNDSLLGGLGADRLQGDAGNDTLDGGEGNDTLLGGIGSDFVNVSSGDDRVVIRSFEELSATESIFGFGLGDVIDLSAIPGVSFVGTGGFSGVAGQIRISNDFGGLSLQIDRDGNGVSDATITLNDSLIGATRPIEMASPGIFTVVAPRNLSGTTAAETLTGAANADTIFGNGSSDTLLGLDGADSLDGGAGNDRLLGGAGNDTLIGGAGVGADTLIGGLGRDRMTGGEGADRFVFESLDDLPVSIGFFSFGADEAITDLATGDLLDFSAIAGFTFTSAAAFSGVAGQARFEVVFDGFATTPYLLIDRDGNSTTDFGLRLEGFTGTLAETTAGSRILAAAGPLNLVGTTVSDTLTGGALGDTLSGLGAADTLNGNGGADSLSGGLGSDVLDGGAGADTLLGGAGGDTLSGGADLDRFVYADGDTNATTAGRDTILDFAAGTGEVIDLSLVDANADLAGEQAFTFIGSAAFSAAGQLRFAGGILQGNTTGTTGAEFQIVLPGVASLTAADLVL